MQAINNGALLGNTINFYSRCSPFFTPFGQTNAVARCRHLTSGSQHLQGFVIALLCLLFEPVVPGGPLVLLVDFLPLAGVILPNLL